MTPPLARGGRADPQALSVAIVGDDRLLMRALYVVARRLGISATTTGHHKLAPDFVIVALRTTSYGARRSAVELATASRRALAPFGASRSDRLVATLRFATGSSDGDALDTRARVRDGLASSVGRGITVVAVRGSSLRLITRTAHVVLRVIVRMVRP